MQLWKAWGRAKIKYITFIRNACLNVFIQLCVCECDLGTIISHILVHCVAMDKPIASQFAEIPFLFPNSASLTFNYKDIYLFTYMYVVQCQWSLRLRVSEYLVGFYTKCVCSLGLVCDDELPISASYPTHVRATSSDCWHVSKLMPFYHCPLVLSSYKENFITVVKLVLLCFCAVTTLTYPHQERCTWVCMLCDCFLYVYPFSARCRLHVSVSRNCLGS